jgi:hypothetical protein
MTLQIKTTKDIILKYDYEGKVELHYSLIGEWNKPEFNKKWVSIDSLQAFIDKQRDEGNVIDKVGLNGLTIEEFSPAICLSDLMKELEK